MGATDAYSQNGWHIRSEVFSRYYQSQNSTCVLEVRVADRSSEVPSAQRMLWPSLEAVREHGESVRIEEHDEAVADKLGLTDEQLSLLHGEGPQTEFRYRMMWARTYLKGIGAPQAMRSNRRRRPYWC